MELKNTMTELEKWTESFKSRDGQVEVSLNTDQLKLSNQRNKKKKEWKRMKNIYSIYGTQLKENIYVLLESQKEKRGRKG